MSKNFRKSMFSLKLTMQTLVAINSKIFKVHSKDLAKRSNIVCKHLRFCFQAMFDRLAMSKNITWQEKYFIDDFENLQKYCMFVSRKRYFTSNFLWFGQMVKNFVCKQISNVLKCLTNNVFEESLKIFKFFQWNVESIWAGLHLRSFRKKGFMPWCESKWRIRNSKLGWYSNKPSGYKKLPNWYTEYNFGERVRFLTSFHFKPYIPCS